MDRKKLNEIAMGMSILILMFMGSCKNDSPNQVQISADLAHGFMDILTKTMVNDIFSPPVASRVYTYPSIAAHETLAAEKGGALTSLSGRVNELERAPEAKTVGVHYPMAALVAQMEVGHQLVFTKDRVVKFRDSLYAEWHKVNPEQFEVSKSYGLEVAQHILDWMQGDNYLQTRTMPKFTVDSEDISRWRPTPPAYIEGIEPHWSKIRPFVLDSANQYRPVPPPAFSLEEDSPFYKEVKEVYEVSETITANGDDSEEIAIARFWDCNPYVSVSRGHLMFASKKITPGGHWMGITKIACRQADFDFVDSVSAYALTAIAIADGFISCWGEKYRSNLVRPETLINHYINSEWEPILQTPPFPEYTSGHSVISTAASEVLTRIFGDDFEYLDDTEVLYGLPERSFKSFYQAAEEAAISRLYGGIHYRAAIENGIAQGRGVGKLVANRLVID